MTLLLDIAVQSFQLLARMGPYLLLGLAVAGALHALLPAGLIGRYLGRPGAGSVFRSSLLGIPLPLCSCGVVPVAASLKRSGASNGAIVGFLVTTPTSGVDSILATGSLLGWAFSLLRVAASFVIGLMAGLMTVLGVRDGGSAPEPAQPQARAKTMSARLRAGLSHGFGELMGGIAGPLLLGSLLGGLIAVLLPPDFLGRHLGDGWLAYLAMLALGIPLYVCASGSIPLAAALLLKGLSPGAALIFLLTGPATNAASVVMISSMLGLRTLIIYLLVLGLGSLGAGYLTDLFFAASPDLLPSFTASHQHGSSLSLLELATGAVLALLSAWHLAKRLRARLFNASSSGDDALVLKVPDMTCSNCARNVTDSIKDLEGVGEFTVDPTTRTVRIRLDGAKPELVTDAIRKAGYKVDRPER